MKIESCPKCGSLMHIEKEPADTPFYFVYPDNDEGCILCLSRGFWTSTLSEKTTARKFNRWARRERRRMKKEAAGR